MKIVKQIAISEEEVKKLIEKEYKVRIIWNVLVDGQTTFKRLVAEVE